MNVNEQSVFAEALEIQDPQAQAAFLDRVCAGNPSLRANVESLLSPHFVNWVSSVAFSKDGTWLACGGDKVIRIWDSETWKLHQELPDPAAGVLSVVFHPQDSRLIAWGSHDGRVKVGNTTTKEIHILPGHQMRGVTSPAFSPDGEWIASSSTDGTIKLRKVPRFPLPPGLAESR